jgi:hypothetical protein
MIKREIKILGGIFYAILGFALHIHVDVLIWMMKNEYICSILQLCNFMENNF